MQKDKHNIYSKEELLKLIKEGKSAPENMDEFDLEAFEGLKLVDKPGQILNELDEEIDGIVAKEKRKKTIYYFSVAASLLLIISLFLLFKNETINNDKPIASAENLKSAEEANQPTTSSIQPETQTTYEAKEPEAPADKTVADKKESGPLLSQTKIVQVPTEEKVQGLKQFGKESYNSEPDTKVALEEREKNYEESKTAAPRAQQEQQEMVVNETTATNNNVASDDETDKDKSKKADVVVTGNATQPAQSVTLYDAKAKANVSSLHKSEENATFQKNATTGASYAFSPNKKEVTTKYREPSFFEGDSAFAAYAKQHLKISSPTNSGIIVVEFLITKTGKAENIKVTKPLNNCDACSQDVIDLIKSVNKWVPAQIDGNSSAAYKKISVQYN